MHASAASDEQLRLRGCAAAEGSRSSLGASPLRQESGRKADSPIAPGCSDSVLDIAASSRCVTTRATPSNGGTSVAVVRSARFWGSAPSRGLSGAAALAAALCSLAPTTAASAQSGVGSSVFVHSARSGELTGGRLTLRGVSRRVTAISSDGRSGVVSVTRLQSRLFLPGQPVTGVLHVAGFRGGDEPTFSLTQPRYNASRRTVSYVAKRLNTRHLPRRGAGAAQSSTPTQFGAASLSMAAPVGDGGNDCETSVGTPTSGGPSSRRDPTRSGTPTRGSSSPTSTASAQAWPPPGSRMAASFAAARTLRPSRPMPAPRTTVRLELSRSPPPGPGPSCRPVPARPPLRSSCAHRKAASHRSAGRYTTRSLVGNDRNAATTVRGTRCQCARRCVLSRA
jgi:hypothetical protein